MTLIPVPGHAPGRPGSRAPAHAEAARRPAGRGAARAAVRRPVRRQGRQRQRRAVGGQPRRLRLAARHLTIERFRELLPEAADLQVDRYELPNLLALNFVVHGLLGQGVSATTRPDPQAKGLGEYLRSRLVTVPSDLA